ncbi:MAG: amidohydrolase family protein [Sphingosinicella sp.]|uniref:amidohydrolase family protein n=1 Tax=Sphingosinicella sp. TaxID=1917971 RepID=UPI0040377DD6
MRSIRSLLTRIACLLAASLAVGAVAQPSRPAPPFAPAKAGERTIYRGATLIDGTGGPARRDMAVIVNGPRIEAVVPAAELAPAQTEGAAIVDLRGRFLLPGLIDSHQHLATPPNRAQAAALMRRALYTGITAVRIMADDLRAIAELDREARAGEIAGPDLHFAAIFAGPSFFEDPRTAAAAAGFAPGTAPWMQAADETTDLPLAIARARGTGAIAIKIYANLPPDMVRSLTEEAHRQGMQVWAHGMVFPTPPAEVIAARPDVISHTCYLAYQLMDERPQSYQARSPIDPAPFAGGDNQVMTRMFRDMGRAGIILDPTLRVYREVERRATPERPPYCTLDLAARLTAQAHRAGVLLSAGTDGDTPRDAPYPALFDELELLVERAGLTPLEAIRAATQIGAMTMEQGQNMGVVAEDYLANLVVLERDPTADVSNMRSVLFTVKNGRRFDRADYRPISSEEMPDED